MSITETDRRKLSPERHTRAKSAVPNTPAGSDWSKIDQLTDQCRHLSATLVAGKLPPKRLAFCRRLLCDAARMLPDALNAARGVATV